MRWIRNSSPAVVLLVWMQGQHVTGLHCIPTVLVMYQYRYLGGPKRGEGFKAPDAKAFGIHTTVMG